MKRKTIKKEHSLYLIKEIFQVLDKYIEDNTFHCQGTAHTIGIPMLKKTSKLKNEAIAIIQKY